MATGNGENAQPLLSVSPIGIQAEKVSKRRLGGALQSVWLLVP